jgi:large subunit ribosomal protein L1
LARVCKRLQVAEKTIDKARYYEAEEAINLLKELSNVKFDETMEVSIRLGIDPKYQDQQVRSNVVLPNGTGKEVRVIVFAKGEKITEAKDAGALEAGAEELVEKVRNGFLDFDRAVATPDMMRDVGKLGKILGPRGLMPNPKTGTVTFDVAGVIKEIKSGRIDFKADTYGIVHMPFGKASFPTEKLYQNLKAIFTAVLNAKPSGAKGQYIKSIYLSTTMGPSIKLDPKEISKKVREE